jgi:hypothetical protein
MLASDVIGRVACDETGEPQGIVVDIVVAPGGPRDRLRITEVVVSPGFYGRLLGFERSNARGPWLVELVARAVRRDIHRLPWERVQLRDAPHRGLRRT